MHDVVIAGAGPVGLFLACELGLAGLDVVVLERDPEPSTPYKVLPLGMRGLNMASARAFHRRGMLPELLEASGASAVSAGGGHFAGLTVPPGLVSIETLPSPANGGLMTSLDAVGSVLEARARKLGVEIVRGAAVTEVWPSDDDVTVKAGELEYVGRWLAGCDGGRSAVRRLAGFDFAGTEPRLTGYTLIGDIDGVSELRPGFNVTPGGMYLSMTPEFVSPVTGARFEGGYVAMLDFDGGAFDRSQSPTPAHLQEVLRRVSGADVTVRSVRHVATFTDRAMQASTYRRGRVLLAGDAAHIHSPLGGQGLNAGIGDALNLGWKLATGDCELLDTYTAERHPVASRVLDWSRAQVATMELDRHARALREVIRDLMGTPDGATYMYGRLSGLLNRYDLGSAHPLVGEVAPEFQLQDGTTLADLMRDGLGVLLDFTGSLGSFDPAVSSGSSVSPTSFDARRLRYVSGPAVDDLGLSAVLIRPDGVVAWAGSPDADDTALASAVSRWFA